MDASKFVGRVGGLAVALGVGAGAFSGSAVAWADDSSTGSDASAGSSAASSSSDSGSSTARHSRGTTSGTRGASRPATARSVADAPSSKAAVKPRSTPAPAAVEPVPVAINDIPVTEPVVTHAPATSPVAESVPSSAPAVNVVAPVADSLPVPEVTAPASAPVSSASAPVSSIVTAAAAPLADPGAGGNPAVPASSPLEWTLLGYTRRDSAVAKAAAALPSAATPAAAAALTLPLILGPSGVPVPSTNYLDTVMKFYLRSGSTPPYASPQPELVFTPEGLYPITGVKSLPLNTSVDQGLAILSDALTKVAPGTPTTVFGYSQSAIIGSLLQAGYVPSPPVNSDPAPTIPVGLRDYINFVFVGNEMNPNGGFLSRFPNLDLPSLGIPFYGPTPENAYPTTNYAREYDGFADFPRYPINFLSDLNAGLGIVFVHTQYVPAPDCRGNYCLTQQQVDDAIALPTTSPTQKYYFIPTANLPLLEPLRLIPFLGNPIADLLQPALKVIVNLGYGDPAHGFATATQPDANVLVPFGLFPDVSPAEVVSQLVAGVKQGIHDFVADFGPQGSIAKQISALAQPNSSLSPATSGDFISTVQHVITAVTERISTSAASLYAALLPTADIINAIVTILPGYNINLALSGIQQALRGEVIAGLTNAIGLPIAADVGLVTTAGLVGVLAWAQAIAGVVGPTASIAA